MDLKFKYFLPHALNQNCIEISFAAIRTHERRNVNPSPTQFLASFKAILLNNFMSRHAVGANCEKDFGVGALDNLRSFVTGEEIAGVFLLSGENTPEAGTSTRLSGYKSGEEPSLSVQKKSRIGQSTTAYFAGYIAKKASKKS